MAALKEEQEIFDAIEVLPIDTKTKIVEKILASITPIEQTMELQWIDEAKRRKREIEESTGMLVDGSRVFEKIAKRLHS